MTPPGDTFDSGDTPHTLIAKLAEHARRRPQGKAFVFLDENEGQTEWTYGDLANRTAAAAEEITRMAAPGDRALLVYPPGLDFVAAFLGCLKVGVLPVPATYPKPRRPLPRLDAIARDCEPSLALTTRSALETMQLDQQSPAVRDLPWTSTDQLECGGASPAANPAVGELPCEGAAFLQYTSGSTSEPRGVVVSHANLMHNLEMIRRGFGIEVDNGAPPVSGVFWLPAYHDMGLIGGVLMPIYIGGTSYLIAPAAFLRRPLVWLQWLSRTGASISGAPNFAYDLCVEKTTPQTRSELDLSRWELAFCGAEPVSSNTLQRFAEAFAPAGFQPDAHYPCYGLAEATLMVTGGQRKAAPRVISLDREQLGKNQIIESSGPNAKTLVGCGRQLGNQEVKIVDPQTHQVCNGRTVGEIWVRGGSIARGYWNGASSEVFDAALQTGDGGFLRTGDLGFLDDGELFVTGRLKDVIIIRGTNRYPQDIERTARDAHAAVDLGAAFSVSGNGGDELVVVHQVDRQHRRGDLSEVLMPVRKAIVEQHEVDPIAIVLIKPASLPLTSSGKVQRSRCRELFESGQLEVLAEWRRGTSEELAVDDEAAPAVEAGPPEFLQRLDDLTVDETTEAVQAWMIGWLSQKLAFPASDLSPTAPFAELGVDSMTSVELALEFEDVLGLRLAPAVALSYPTPAELSRYLAEQLKGVDSSPPPQPAATS